MIQQVKVSGGQGGFQISKQQLCVVEVVLVQFMVGQLFLYFAVSLPRRLQYQIGALFAKMELHGVPLCDNPLADPWD